MTARKMAVSLLEKWRLQQLEKKLDILAEYCYPSVRKIAVSLQQKCNKNER